MSTPDPKHPADSQTSPSQQSQGKQAVQGTGILCFAAVIAGDIFFLRQVLSQKLFSEYALPFWLEAASWLVLLIGILYLWTHKKGWDSPRAKILVFTLFGLYTLYSVLFYSEFSQAYATSLAEDSLVLGKALVGVKLVLVLIGLTAGIPVGPKVDDREYAHRLREKAIARDAEWAKASVKGAKKELAETVEKLKNTLSPDELQALLEELQASSPVSSPETAANPSSEPNIMPETSSLPEAESRTSTDLESIHMETEDVRKGWSGGI